MSERIDRRSLLLGLLATRFASAAGSTNEALRERLAELEAEAGGRLGVCALDPVSGRSIGLREHERFAMCSTFKLLLAAAVLRRVDRSQLHLYRKVTFDAGDMVSHAPVTAAKLSTGWLSIGELCAAAVKLSDNPAANLLLEQIGGPAGLTADLRSMGDTITRLDRNELALNSNLRGDERDTTTPHAMAHTAARVLAGDILSAGSRQMLVEWTKASPTGARRIRAGLPSGWTAGDKTGTGANGAVNDVAIVWPPGRGPLILAIYMSESPRPVAELEPVHARVAGLVAEAVTAALPESRAAGVRRYGRRLGSV
ncbi:MAG TPA: class A beta-lactamase [Povalibacter sp.]|uniref:class A beta-lactamase n=1 Tax=Povalibacter sp. TaxID=1962978 RepID=UPI002D100A57|nr:class A beta-lactamase [Povalibacter sp.]HMN46389.1 class A beta-lactamase [Povalibacter sp.]